MLLGLGKTLTFGQKKIYPYATGGDYVYLYEEGGKTYRVHEFHTTGTSTLNVEDGGQVEYLVVGGGGGGGRGKGGGGGGGGALYGSTNVSEENITISVGAGGTGAIYSPASGARNGMDSSFNGIVAYGGGFGGGWVVGRDGGTGGAGGGGLGVRNDTPGTGAPGITGQGYAGGDGVNTSSTTSCAGGGGGGAGETGQDASINVGGNGGSGIEWPSGSGRYYGGGGGGYVESGTPGSGGTGGGGAGATTTNDGANGLTNTGGGGGGGGASYLSDGGDGGSGIVIVRYVIAEKTLWTPSELTSTSIWVDMDALNLTNGTGITTLTDQSGNGYDLTDPNSGNDHATVVSADLNGRDVADFQNLGGYSLSGWPGQFGNEGYMFAAVVEIGSASTNAYVSDLRYNNTQLASFTYSSANETLQGGNQRRLSSDSGVFVTATGVGPTTGWALVVLAHDYTSGAITLRMNGSTEATGTLASTGTGPHNNLSVTLGSRVDNTLSWNNKMAEALWFDDRLTTGAGGDLERVEGYLAHKWGLTDNLPSGHPYKYESPYKEEPEEIVTDGLVLNLDAGDYASYPRSGTTWYDISGNGNNGTLTNGPTYDSANKGSIVFDGVDDFINFSSSLSFTNGYTFSFWLKLTNEWNSSSTGSPWLLDARGPNTDTYAYFITGGYFRYRTFNPTHNLDSTQTTWESGKWYFITCTLDSDKRTKKLYINGNFDASYTLGSDADFSTSAFQIGRYSNGSFFDEFEGNISSFQIHNRALSSTEIAQNYDALKGRYGL